MEGEREEHERKKKRKRKDMIKIRYAEKGNKRDREGERT